MIHNDVDVLVMNLHAILFDVFLHVEVFVLLVVQHDVNWVLIFLENIDFLLEVVEDVHVIFQALYEMFSSLHELLDVLREVLEFLLELLDYPHDLAGVVLELILQVFVPQVK
ncbi:hypothetical protein PVT01_000007300 [Plasmodium vivax]|uniref:Uncharacterized protein n=1 Tax=Plasmodium vivax TaxID=5855 RepID=A0A1G4ECM8_PLAVI|nr:hypothetical protein PVT01_000007300 [Plasmodium vivax]